MFDCTSVQFHGAVRQYKGLRRGSVDAPDFADMSMNTPKHSPEVATPKRRPQSRSDSEATKERILDSAEKLFARFGYHAASIRDIAAEAECQSALVGYHFGSKQELMDRVLARRSEVLNAERLAFLERARVQSQDAPIRVRTLLEGYVGTILKRAARNDQGWRNYTQMVAMAASSAEWSELTDKHFNAVARAYLEELHRSQPEISAEDLHQGFFFAVGAMVNVCARPGRIETLSKGQFKSKDVSELYDNLCTFLEGGFMAMARRGLAPPGPSGQTKEDDGNSTGAPARARRRKEQDTGS